MDEAIYAVLRSRGCDQLVAYEIGEMIMHWRAVELFAHLFGPRSYLMLIPRDITRLITALLDGSQIAGSLFFADPRRWGRSRWDNLVTSSSCTVYDCGRRVEYFTTNSQMLHQRYRNGYLHGWCQVNIGDLFIDIRIIYFFMGCVLVIRPGWPNMIGEYWSIWNPDGPSTSVPKDTMTEW